MLSVSKLSVSNTKYINIYTQFARFRCGVAIYIVDNVIYTWQR